MKWSAVDLDAGQITVHDNRVVVGGKALDKAGGKTRNADKTISIDRATVEALRQWREVQTCSPVIATFAASRRASSPRSPTACPQSCPTTNGWRPSPRAYGHTSSRS